jgi:hypothetical protein
LGAARFAGTINLGDQTTAAPRPVAHSVRRFPLFRGRRPAAQCAIAGVLIRELVGVSVGAPLHKVPDQPQRELLERGQGALVTGDALTKVSL